MIYSLKRGVVSSSLPLARSESVSGQIHSLFKSSLNIAFGEELVNVANSRMQCSSFGLKLEDDKVDQLIQSAIVADRVVQKGSRLILYSSYGGVIEIDLAKLEVIDLKVKPVEITPERIELISRVLSEMADLEQVGLPMDERTVAVLRGLTDQGMKKEALDTAFEHLIGRGKGLTPSGDDVLLGYLLMCKLFGKSPCLEQYRVKQNINRTTLISANYLRELCRGFVSEYFQNFCLAAARMDEGLMRQSVEQIKNVGATSGHDMLLGMSLGISKIGGTIVKFPETVLS